MAVSLPGDIVLDVARAADPQKVAAARAKLQAPSGGATPAAAFQVAVDARPAPRTTAHAGVPEHFVQFESMVLQNFLTTMLPEDNATVFGKGLSGEMWRTMLAQQIGEAMARQGGIGIAERVLGDHLLEDGKKAPIAGVTAGPAAKEAAENSALSTAMIEQLERTMAKSLADDDET
ncbi:rod-binding protein [Nitratireductor thuwali]|uniref:Flagellar protein FlgJ N-terminal domain-containing protein n=1 Tax=Nitratireductor thuwali TaxID=2267699 RepID=A0ABY5MFM8_9HYPH|nr:hypothetical protein NTH_01282 [Nitratireductor thuwali]